MIKEKMKIILSIITILTILNSCVSSQGLESIEIEGHEALIQVYHKDGKNVRHGKFQVERIHRGQTNEPFKKLTKSPFILTGEYKHGEKYGTWKYFDEKGNIIKLEVYGDYPASYEKYEGNLKIKTYDHTPYTGPTF